MLLLVVLNFEPTQRIITEMARNALSKELGTHVSIGSIEIGLFNRVLLKDVKMTDLSHKEMLRAKTITAKIELRSLLPKRPLALRSVSLIDAQINLYKSKADQPANFQFVIDALSNKKKKKPSTIDLRINSLILRRVAVKYDEWYKAFKPNKLNLSHLEIGGINANVSLKHISDSDISLRVRSLALHEQSGFELKDMTFKLQATRTHATISDFELKLTHSIINHRRIEVQYDTRNGLKYIFKTLHLQCKLENTTIATNDLFPILPIKHPLKMVVNLKGIVSISPHNIVIRQFSATEANDSFSLFAETNLTRVDGRISAISTHIKNLQVEEHSAQYIMQTFTTDTTAINILKRAGKIKLEGNGYYKVKGDGLGSAQIVTSEGSLLAKLTWIEAKHQLITQFQITDLRTSYLLAQPKLPNGVTANGNVNILFNKKKLSSVAGNINISQLDWNGQTLSSLKMNGYYTPDSFKAFIDSRAPTANLTAEASVQMQGKQIDKLQSRVEVRNITPALLGIYTHHGQATFSGIINAELSRLGSADKIPIGHVSLKDFNMTNSPYGDYKLTHFDLDISPTPLGEIMKLRSDFADVNLRGNLMPKTFIATIGSIVNQCLPGLWKKSIPAWTKHSKSNLWQIDASIKKSDVFHNMLGINLTLSHPFTLRGVLDATGGRTSITASTEDWSFSGQKFGATSLYLNGSGSRYQCLLKTHKIIANKQFNIIADFKTIDSTLVTQVSWQAPSLPHYEGNFKSSTRFDIEKSSSSPHTTSLEMRISPTDFVLADTIWHIASGALTLRGRELAINNLNVSHADQSLTANGRIAPGKNDSIVAHLNKIDIDYILEMINFHAVEFGGRATGIALFTQRGGNPEVNAYLRIPDFKFNGGRMGTTDIIGGWRKDNNCITLDANMKLPDIDNDKATTNVRGQVDLAQKAIQLYIKAQHTNLQFLRRYMDGIFTDFDGEATGNVHLYGPFKALDFEGEVKATASAKIISTGVRYEVSGGHVTFAPGIFSFKDFNVTDGRGGKGHADGNLQHTHLKKLTYDFNLNAEHMLCYDQKESTDLPFYSTTTGSGSITLNGRPGLFTADINLSPDAPTTLVYTMGNEAAISTNDNMVHFHDAQEHANNDSIKLSSEEVVQSNNKEGDSGTDIWLNFLINANPSAQVKIITDPRAGDAITAFGNGPIRATWHNKGNFEMYGTYTLTRGTYNLSIQDVIRKDLQLVKGSTLTFSGNPLEADLGLKAKYTVNGVSLSDLNYGAGFSQKSAKVDCILNIGGKAKNPQVDFDLDLQGISDDEKQMVRQLIATEEDMNRQVIYLLGIGRFYTANAESPTNSISSQQQSSSAMRSFLSSTLTGQLNSAISSVLGTDSHWNIGTNVAPGTLGWSDVEVDGLLQGRLLNDRLLINGNFGYRDRPTYTSNFIGDFDIRYLLTPRGSVSLRAYSETTDRYFIKSSLTTQGIGLTLQKDFNKLSDLFWWRKKKTTKAQIGTND